MHRPYRTFHMHAHTGRLDLSTRRMPEGPSSSRVHQARGTTLIALLPLLLAIIVLSASLCACGSSGTQGATTQGGPSLNVSVDGATVDSDSSPVGVVATGNSTGTAKVNATSGGSTQVQRTQDDYVVSFDNDYYLASDGTLLQAGSAQNATVSDSQTTDVTLHLDTIDYSTLSETDAEARIDDAADYIVSTGDTAKAETLKTAALKANSAAHVEAVSTTAGVLKVHYIDVGQGDSEFLELPDGKTMLIDAGPRSAAATVVSYLRAQGCTRIDYLVASHPHEDHIGGMASVLSSFEVGEVWAPKVTHTTSTYESFLDAVAAKGLSINSAVAGKRILDSGGCTIDLLAPRNNANYTDLNDWSAVCELRYGSRMFLFPGDASKGVLDGVCTDHIDVLKVAHHGSRTGTDATLVSKITPTYAVISCGVDNTYGHPHAEALAALAGVTLFRTDQQGSIVASCDGNSITFSTGATKASASSSGAAATSTASGDTTVYITKTGKKYHTEGCTSLSKSKIAISLEDAKQEGYTACSKCNPPS